MRFFDYLWREGFVNYSNITAKPRPLFTEDAASVHRFVIDNVDASLPLTPETLTDPPDLDLSLYSKIMAPYEAMWMEYKEQPGVPRQFFGVVISRHKVRDGWVHELIPFSRLYLPPLGMRNVCEDVKQRIFCLDDGTPQLAGVKATEIYSGGEPPPFDPAILKALALCNCVNVESVLVSNQRGGKKSRRKTVGLEYHILQIKPTGERKKHADSIPSGLKMPQHFRRGCIRRYTQEKPLFGKWVGQWWWEACVVGKQESGVVDKDYEVMSE